MSQENQPKFEKKEGSFEDSFSLESTIKTINAAEESARVHLQELGWSEDDAEYFALVVREMVANAVIHGNLEVFKTGPDDMTIGDRVLEAEKSERSKKKVQITFRFTSDRAEAEIADEGHFLPENDPISDFKENDMSTNGRGFSLLGFRMNDIDFSPGGVRFALNRDKEGHF